jgi:hypothetical protein
MRERERVKRDWRIFHSELYNSYSSKGIRVMKSRRMKWEGRVARMGNIRDVS